MDDLADFHVGVEPAISVTFRGSRIYSCGPWCQGPALLQMLSMLEGVDLASLEHNSSAYVHRLVETMKLAFADRHRYFGDPRFVDVPLRELLSSEYCAARRSSIGESTARQMLSVGEEPLVKGGGDPSPYPGARTLSPLDTSYVAVIDSRGNVFSATPSDVSYDTPVIPGTGLCPSSRGSQSWSDPSHPSSVAPGKRPRLTPAPFLARAAGGYFSALGTPGGDVQLQALLQVWLNMEVFGMSPQAAVEAPRFATYDFQDSFEPHHAYPGRLNVETRFGVEVLSDLRNRGHDIALWPDWAWRAGAVCVARQRPGGVLEAAADPRRPAYALGR